MILVTGATGHFGKAAIDFLLSKKIATSELAALVRDSGKAVELRSKGISLRQGDYFDYPSLVNAFQGVDKLLFVSSSDLNERTQQHINVVNAAKEAGVKHIIYTSFFRKTEENSPIQMVSQSHLDAENAIRASGLTYTILKNSMYADMLPLFMGDKVLETGIFLPAGDGKAAFTTRADMAEAAANILTSEGHDNKEYVLATENNYSFHDAAAVLSELSGKKVAYTSPVAEAYVEVLTNAGVPAAYVNIFASFSEAIKQGEFFASKSDLENLLHRKPTSLKEYFKSVYFSKN